MKKFILLFSTLLLGAGLFAQTVPSRAQGDPGKNNPLTVTVRTEGPLIFGGNGGKSAAIDTVFPAALALACASQPVVFTTAEMGFVFGSNEFSDIEKLQRITLDAEETFTVESVLVAFASAAPELANVKLVANIYTDLDASGNFGTFLGASDTMTVTELGVYDTTVVFSQFAFSTPVEVENLSSFLIGIDISDVYTNNTGNVGILSTPADCGSGENVLEIFPNQQGSLSFNTVFANWSGLNAEMFVGAIIDVAEPSATRNPVANYGARVFPNPASDRFNLQFTAPTAGDYLTRLVAPDGRVVREIKQTISGGNATVQWNIEGLASGLYLYQVSGNAGVQTGKVIIR